MARLDDSIYFTVDEVPTQKGPTSEPPTLRLPPAWLGAPLGVLCGLLIVIVVVLFARWQVSPAILNAGTARAIAEDAAAKPTDIPQAVKDCLVVIGVRAKQGDRSMNYCNLADKPAETRDRFVAEMRSRSFTVERASEKLYGKLNGCLTIRW